MTDKLVLATVSEAQANSSLMAAINSNSSSIVTAMDNTLSRDGTSPNQMMHDFDMNSYHILNLPAPINDADPVRLVDLNAAASGASLVSVTGSGRTVLQTSPALLGTPTAPTAVAGTNTTQLATTAFTQGLLNSAALTGTPTAPTATLGTNTTQIATTAFVLANAGAAGTGSGITSVRVQDPTIDNTGVIDVHTKLQTAITAICTANNIVYIPAGTYNMGGGSLIIPDYATVICHDNAVIKRTADPATPPNSYSVYTACMIVMGNYCRWSGGTLNNNVVVGTSTTSNTIGSGGTKTFTTQAGLNITGGAVSFLRIWSAANPANKYEGTVSSYSGTTLVLNASFSGGSGTYSDWQIGNGAVYQCAMTLHSVVDTEVENVRVTGNWYVGMLMDAVNPAIGGPAIVSRCAFRNCWAENVQNRAFYLAGTIVDSEIEGCMVSGGSGITDYAFNCNGFNATGSANTQIGNKITNCTASDCAFQGFELGDNVFYSLVSGCVARNITNATGVGFLCQFANSNTCQYNTFTACRAVGCGGEGFAFIGVLYGGATGCSAILCGQGFYIAPSGGTQSQFIDLVGCESISSTTINFHIVGNSNRCSGHSIKAVAGGTVGVQIDAAATFTIFSGRSVSNVTSNYVDNGTFSSAVNLSLA